MIVQDFYQTPSNTGAISYPGLLPGSCSRSEPGARCVPPVARILQTETTGSFSLREKKTVPGTFNPTLRHETRDPGEPDITPKRDNNTTGGEQVERKEFLSILGLGAAAVACSYCFDGCTTPDAGGNITAPTNVDFTLDLTNPAYSGLKSAGGYVYNAGVIVAHAASGYVAVSQACTHQGTAVIFDSPGGQFFCPAHGSRFSLSGAVVNGPAGSPLGSYKTSLTGNSLRVFS